MQETQVWSLDWEDPLEKKMATYFSILAWRIPWTEKPGGLQSMGSRLSDWACTHTQTHTHTHTHTQSMGNVRRNVDTMLIHRDGDKRLRNPLRLVREEDFNSFSTWGSHIYQSNRTLTEVRLYGWLTMLRVIKERNKKRACFEGKQQSGWLQNSAHCYSKHKYPIYTVKVKVAQSHQTLSDPTVYTAHGILQARIPE